MDRRFFLFSSAAVAFVPPLPIPQRRFIVGVDAAVSTSITLMEVFHKAHITQKDPLITLFADGLSVFDETGWKAITGDKCEQTPILSHRNDIRPRRNIDCGWVSAERAASALAKGQRDAVGIAEDSNQCESAEQCELCAGDGFSARAQGTLRSWLLAGKSQPVRELCLAPERETE